MRVGQFRTRGLARLAVVLLGVLAVAGCATKATGGGTILSTDGIDQANFGFTYKITDLSTGAGEAHGAYHDPTAVGFPLGGVEFKFDGLLSGDTGSVDGCLVDDFGGTLSYTSQNPNYPGSGELGFDGCDNGQPGVNRGGNSDSIDVDVLSGPYAGYFNQQFLTGGNVRAHN